MRLDFIVHLISILSVIAIVDVAVFGICQMNERKHSRAFAGDRHAPALHDLGKETLTCPAADNGEVVRLDRSGQQIQLLTLGGRTPLLAVVS